MFRADAAFAKPEIYEALEDWPFSELTVCPSRASLSTRLNLQRGGEYVHDRLSEQIATLPSLNKAQLLAIWAENFSKAPLPNCARN